MMKKMLAILLFTGASLQANDLADSWRNFGKNSRIASGLKAVVVGLLAFESTRASFAHGKLAVDIAASKEEWSNKWQLFVREGVICGSTAGTAFTLGYYFLPEHLKHALAMS